MTLAWPDAVMGRESFCMSVSVVSQVYEMTMLETNCSQNSIDMSYREFMMCKWSLSYRDSKVGIARLWGGRSAVVVINTTMQWIVGNNM